MNHNPYVQDVTVFKTRWHYNAKQRGQVNGIRLLSK